jgi:serine protease Do
LAQGGAVRNHRRIKPTIVVVGTLMRSRAPAFELKGTGFVVGDGTLVATNAHVAGVTLDDRNSRRWQCLRMSTAASRCARRASSPPVRNMIWRCSRYRVQLCRRLLGDSSRVTEGQSIAFTGFPIGGVLGFTPVTHRGIVAAITPIVIPVDNVSQLNAPNRNRLARGSFPVFQLDATAYPGNSGSPVFDPDSGEVIGVVNMVLVKAGKESVLAQPSGITYAIPASHLAAMIAAQP